MGVPPVHFSAPGVQSTRVGSLCRDIESIGSRWAKNGTGETPILHCSVPTEFVAERFFRASRSPHHRRIGVPPVHFWPQACDRPGWGACAVISNLLARGGPKTGQARRLSYSETGCGACAVISNLLARGAKNRSGDSGRGLSTTSH